MTTTTEVPAWMTEMLASAGIDKLHPALTPWIRQTEIMGPMVKHPFVFGSLGGDEALYAGMLSQNYDAKREMRREFLAEKNWWPFLFLLVERPWRMVMLERLFDRGRITRDEMRELLPEVWTDTEAPQVNQAGPVRLFREAGFSTDDPEGWDELAKQDEIVLYRGVDGHLELTADGPSWTLSRKTAEFFAYRWEAKGSVYSYTAKPSEALAYLTSRGEAEIILDFDAGEGGASDDSRIQKVA